MGTAAYNYYISELKPIFLTEENIYIRLISDSVETKLLHVNNADCILALQQFLERIKTREGIVDNFVNCNTCVHNFTGIEDVYAAGQLFQDSELNYYRLLRDSGVDDTYRLMNSSNTLEPGVLTDSPTLTNINALWNKNLTVKA